MMNKALISFLLLAMVGCTSTPLTTEEQYERDDALVVERQNFWIRYDACLMSGGTIILPSHGGIRSRTRVLRPTYTIWEMRDIRCAK